jgi:hypothetical protein
VNAIHYNVIYCDCPWEYKVWSQKGQGRSAASHYDTMTIEALCALPVADIASIEPLPSFADAWKQRAYTRGALRLDAPGPPVVELRLRALRPSAVTRVLVAVDDPAAFITAVRTTADPAPRAPSAPSSLDQSPPPPSSVS